MLPPPPREVIDTKSAFQRWLPRIIMVPHTVMALAIIAFFVLVLAMVLFGRPTEARVRHGALHTGPKGAVTCQLDVDYPVGGQTHSAVVQVGAAFCGEALDAQGAPLPGREGLTLRRVGFPVERAELADGGPNSGLLCGAPLGLFWLLVVASVGRQAWLRPMRERWLVRHGVELPGQVVEVKALAAKGRAGPRRELTVEYRDALGVPYQVKAVLVGAGAPGESPVGAPVVVLADPDRPGRAVIHGHAEYRVSA